MKKIISISFILVLLFPLFLGEYQAVRENESTEEIDQYISENFGLRKELIYANSIIDTRFLRSSSNTEVLVGREGWLYLAETLQVKEIDDWSASATKLKELEIRASKNGTRLVVVLVPDKRSVYPEFLPSRFSDWNNDNYLRLVNALRLFGVTVVDLKNSLLAQKEHYQLYSRQDTHWNRVGAFLAFKEALNAMKASVSSWDSIGSYTREGDLSRLLGLEEEEETLDINLPPNLVEQKLGTLIFYHDSFGEGMFPFLEKSFNKIEPRTNEDNYIFDISDEDLKKADVLMVEVVERDLNILF